MGRIFLSQRLGVRATAGMPTEHASEARSALDDPLGAALLAVLLEFVRGTESRAAPL